MGLAPWGRRRADVAPMGRGDRSCDEREPAGEGRGLELHGLLVAVVAGHDAALRQPGRVGRGEALLTPVVVPSGHEAVDRGDRGEHGRPGLGRLGLRPVLVLAVHLRTLHRYLARDAGAQEGRCDPGRDAGAH